MRQSLSQRVNRDNPLDVNGTVLAGFDHFGFRMIDGARLQRFEFAVDKDLVPLLEILFHERQIPPTTVKPGCAVIKNQFKDRFGAPLVALQTQGHHVSPDGSPFAQLQIGDTTEMAPVLIAPRPMQQQIMDSRKLQASQLRRALRANPAKRFELGG